MKNLDAPISSYFDDDEVDVEIVVELHNMIHFNISEKQHCFVNQLEMPMISTLDNLAMHFFDDIKQHLVEKLDETKYLE